MLYDGVCRMFLSSCLLGGSYDWALLAALVFGEVAAVEAVVERARVDVYLGGGLDHLLDLVLELDGAFSIDAALLSRMMMYEGARRHSCFSVTFK